MLSISRLVSLVVVEISRLKQPRLLGSLLLNALTRTSGTAIVTTLFRGHRAVFMSRAITGCFSRKEDSPPSWWVIYIYNVVADHKRKRAAGPFLPFFLSQLQSSRQGAKDRHKYRQTDRQTDEEDWLKADETLWFCDFARGGGSHALCRSRFIRSQKGRHFDRPIKRSTDQPIDRSTDRCAAAPRTSFTRICSSVV